MMDYKKAVKESKKSQHDQVKSELLRDIVDRLSQKVALQMLKINSKVKREIYVTFEIYYVEYIARDYVKNAIKSI